MTEKEWIEKMAPAAVAASKKWGCPASALIGMSCQENGYGMDSSCDVLTAVNNVLGMKAELLNDTWTSDYWDGSYIEKQTPEWRNGWLTYIKDRFRKYKTLEDCFLDFGQFLHDAKLDDGTYKYRDVLTIRDPAEFLKEVRTRGYCTDPAYDYSIVKIIAKHDLTKYDTEGDDNMGSININRQYITTNNTNSTNDPKYIIIHNTDNFSKGADALAHAKGLYNGDMSGMSWHYVVDETSWFQCIEHNRGAWHVGKNYGSNNLFGTVNNRNSICIEMCVNAGYDYEAAFQNTVALTRHLMKELDIPADRVLQHYDVCSKDCPSQIRARGDWARFKLLISAQEEEEETAQAAEDSAYVVKFQTIHKGDNGAFVLVLQIFLRSAGYKGENGQALKLDGDFGGNTEFALKAYQADHGLKSDGWCGPITWADIVGLPTAA